MTDSHVATRYRTLEEGERVEFEAAPEEVDGTLRAIRVTGPGGTERAGPARYTDEERQAAKEAKEAAGPWWTARAKARESKAPAVEDADIRAELQLQRHQHPRAAAAAAAAGPPPGGSALEFVLVVDGPLTDRDLGSDLKATWAEADCAQKNRRDALVRSLVAALCSPGERCWLLFVEPRVVVLLTREFLVTACGGSTTECTVLSQLDAAFRSCLRDGAAAAAKETNESPASPAAHVRPKEATAGVVFACCATAKQQAAPPAPPPPHAAAAAAAGLGSAHGVSVYTGFETVCGCAAFVLQARSLAAAGRTCVVNMHDSAEAFLPVYAAAAGGQKTAQSAAADDTADDTADGSGTVEKALVVMGVVHDHLSTVQLLVRTAGLLGMRTAACNLVHVAMYTSKCIHVIQAHHAAGSFLPAVAALSAEADPEAACAERVTVGSLNRIHGTLLPDLVELPGDVRLHFWSWHEWGARGDFQAQDLLDSEQHLETDDPGAAVPDGAGCSPPPAGGTSEGRARAHVLQQLVIAAIARSHGSDPDARISFTFMPSRPAGGGLEEHHGDKDAPRSSSTVTIGSSLIRTHMPRRGYRACTEHNILQAMVDNIQREKKNNVLMVHAKPKSPSDSAGASKVFKFWQLNIAIRAWIDDQQQQQAMPQPEEAPQLQQQQPLQQQHQEEEAAGASSSGTAAGGLVRESDLIVAQKRKARVAMPPVPSGLASLARFCLVLVIDPDAECELRLYDDDAAAASAAAANKHGGGGGPTLPSSARLHIMFARPAVGLTAASIRSQVAAQLPVVVCRAPCGFGDAAEDPVRLAVGESVIKC
jgi:hypothetical protein